MAKRETTGWQWLDPAVEAELQRPRGRGRPPADLDALRWAASLRIYGIGLAHDPARSHAINQDVLGTRSDEIAALRRRTLSASRSVGRDADQLARRVRVAVFMALRQNMSDQSLAAWIKRTCKDAGFNVTVRTVRADIGAIRKAGSATHQ